MRSMQRLSQICRGAIVFAGLGFLTITASASAQRDAEASPAVAEHAASSRLPANARPLHYRLSIAPDAARLAFRATAMIDVEVIRRSEALVLNGLELDIEEAALNSNGGNLPLSFQVDNAAQTIRLIPSRPLEPGTYRISIAYRGTIQTQPFGLFARDYTADGAARRALFTQFEPGDARRVFPSFDEPGFRAPFALSLTVGGGETAVSNMPETESVRNDDGTKTISFAMTPPMSTYLLFFAVGDFERIHRRAGNTEVGIVTRRGASNRAEFALASASQLLPYFNDYFRTPYPLPRLDNVAAPGSGSFFNAMENWGAILTFEDYLLVDPALTSESRRRQIFSAIAHEISHQWFGNLVTMAWWDDLWLNEAFASWMANKATNDLHPDWEPLLDRIRSRELAMELDSLPGSHPVIQPAGSVEQITEAFDDITYSKGEAVIVMLEGYVGPEAWQRGIADYLRQHRLGNTVSADLWASLATASRKPIAEIARDFTLQPGVPLIRVEEVRCVGGRTVARLRQDEFVRGPSQRSPRRWRIPVKASVIGGGTGQVIVDGPSAQLDVPGCGTLVVNSGQTGYYRTLYEPAHHAALLRDFARLDSIDRLGLIADNWGLALGGYQPASLALRMIEAIPSGSHAEIWEEAGRILLSLARMYENDPTTREGIVRFASGTLGGELARLGWDARTGESSGVLLARTQLIETLGALGDAQVAAEANRRFAQGRLEGALRAVVLEVVVANADSRTWDALHAQARVQASPLARGELYLQLASARDPALARRALGLAIGPEAGSGLGGRMIEQVARIHPDLAFGFAVENRAAVLRLVDSFSLPRFIPSLAAGSYRPGSDRGVLDFAERFPAAASRNAAEVSASTIRQNLRIREIQGADIRAWFEGRAVSGGVSVGNFQGVGGPLVQDGTPDEGDVPQVGPVAVRPAGEGEPDPARFLMVRELMYAVRLEPQFLISSDGRSVAYVSDVTGEPQLWSVGSSGGWPTQLTFGAGIDWIEPAPNPDQLLYGADTGGDERTTMNMISMDGRRERAVLPASRAFRNFGAFSSDGRQLAYASTERNGRDYDIYVADVATGQSRRIYEGRFGFYPLAWQPGGSLIVVREQRGETGENLHLLDAATGRLRTILNPSRAASYKNIHWVPDGAGFYLSTNEDGDFARVAYYDLAAGTLSTVASPPHEVREVDLSGDGRYIAWTTIETGFNTLHVMDLRTRQEIEVPPLPRGTTDIEFASDAPVLALGSSSARTATRIYVWDIPANRLSLAVPSQDAGLDLSGMVDPEPVAFTARDGVTLTGLLYMPSRPFGGARPPVFLALHGGPSNHAQPGFQPDLQYLVSRGIAVLDFNYRGSTGQGQAFASLNDRERKADEIGDVADAVTWLRSTGRVDGSRIAIGGASYGGYLTNAALGTYPDMFVAGVSIVGISDWVTALENASPFLKSSDRFEFGDISEPRVRDFFARLSPINNAARIRTPLMVLHGANDVRDPVSESDRFVAAIRAAGGTVSYLRFQDEGHDFTRLANRAYALRRIAAFLEGEFSRPRSDVHD